MKFALGSEFCVTELFPFTGEDEISVILMSVSEEESKLRHSEDRSVKESHHVILKHKVLKNLCSI